MAIEIVSFLIKLVIFHGYIYIYVNVFQRVVQQFREKYESHRLYVIKQF